MNSSVYIMIFGYMIIVFVVNMKNIEGDKMISTEEIDWVLDQLGYYIILDGGINLFPDMDNYWKIEEFFYLSPQTNADIIVENSEADGKTWYFDTKEFESYIDDYVDELILESHQDYIFRKFLRDIYMPKYYENKEKR